jgi:hypothetical protein
MADKETTGSKAMWPSFETASRIVDIANFFLIVSLVMGVIATVLIVWMGNKKEEHLTAELSARAADAAHANLQISALNIQAKSLEESTAQANARAAEAQLELAKIKTPRSLDSEQQARIVRKIKAFSGTPFTVSIFSTPEVTQLLEMIEPTLKSAGWVQKPWQDGDLRYSRPDKTDVGMNSIVGLYVQASLDHAAQLRPPLETLVKALHAEGLAVKGRSGY